MNESQTEAQRWFRQAQADRQVVTTLRGASHHAAACFHSHQAAEKALKAVLYSQGARFVFGHSVSDLARQCLKLDVAFEEISADAGLLDQFYIPTRYPNGLPLPAVPSEAYTDAQSEVAEQAMDRVLGRAETFLRGHTNVLDTEDTRS